MKNRPIEFLASPETIQKVDRETFLSTLMKNLILAKEKFPDLYAWPNTDVLKVFRELAENLDSGNYSRFSHAIKWTCKELKVKNDRKSIDLIFKGEK